MARWVCQDRPRRILDPAAGDGVFLRAVESALSKQAAPCRPRNESRNYSRRREDVRLDAYEIDEDLFRLHAGPAGPDGPAPSHPATADGVCLQVRWHCADFITTDVQRRYDAVIANPPYIRHHALSYDERQLAVFDELCGRRLSRTTNLYGLFLVKIASLLREGGRAAVITPAEWLNADFGVAIKAYLLERNVLDAVVYFDHAATVFEDALTTAAITLLRRGRSCDEPVRLLRVDDPRSLTGADLEGLNAAIDRQAPSAELNPSAKWTPLFSRGSARRARATGAVLGDIAACMRGIATGANGYFTLRESDRRRLGIRLEDLLPCVTKAQQLRDGRFSMEQLQALIDADERIYLLHPRPSLTEPVQRYLEEGRRLGVDRRYLPSHRPVWYLPEHRTPAPILVSVFARGRFRFVRNGVGVLNLTAYHGIYPRTPTPDRIEGLFKYLTSATAQARLREHCRVYADGLLKVEPRDVESLPIPRSLAKNR